MNCSSKIIFTILTVILFGGIVQAQDNKKELSGTIGLVLSSVDLASPSPEFPLGIHIGLNLYSKNIKPIMSDLQLSINVSSRRSGSGLGSLLSINSLYGVRFYFGGQNKSTAIFGNALIGGVLISEAGGDFTETTLGFGYSAGLFIDMKKFIVGLSAESYNSLILKLGYAF